MFPGFHCSSLDYHHPAMLIPKLASLGFRAIALRPRRGGLDLDAPWYGSAAAEIAGLAKENDVAIVLDLDSPFYDDPDSVHAFSLASDDPLMRQRAQEQIQRWIEQGAELCPTTITFSTGRVGQATSLGRTSEETLERLAESLESLSRKAAAAEVNLALRPVAEHAIATVAHFERFGHWLGSETSLGLAADVGEMLLGGEFPIGARLARIQHRLTCVYLCEPDVERGCDQRFGYGDIDLRRVWEVMIESGFTGPAIFRACGHSRLGLDLARQAVGLAGLSPP